MRRESWLAVLALVGGTALVVSSCGKDDSSENSGGSASDNGGQAGSDVGRSGGAAAEAGRSATGGDAGIAGEAGTTGNDPVAGNAGTAGAPTTGSAGRAVAGGGDGSGGGNGTSGAGTTGGGEGGVAGEGNASSGGSNGASGSEGGTNGGGSSAGTSGAGGMGGWQGVCSPSLYFTTDDGQWHGCLSMYATADSSIAMDSDSMSRFGGSLLCVQGTIAGIDASTGVYAYAGINLNFNQDLDSTAPNGWTPTEDIVGIWFSFDAYDTSRGLRIQISGPDEGPDTQRWCKYVTPGDAGLIGRSVPMLWSEFTTRCWDENDPGDPYAGEELSSLQFQKNGSGTAGVDVTYRYCLNSSVRPWRG